MTTNYTSLPGLAGVYLEDSFVTAIREDDDSLVFDLDAVLTPAHPAYHEPEPGEQYCYVAANLTFVQPSKIEWISRTSVRSIDVDGLEDLGNVDTLRRSGDVYRLTGDWGEVAVRTHLAPRFAIVQGST